MGRTSPSIVACCTAEFIGTFLLVLIGCGALHTAVTTGTFGGAWETASVWGFGVCLAVYAVGSVSGAHINPAITVCMAVWDGFPTRRVLPYCAAQLLGALVAAVVLHLIFSDAIAAFELSEEISRGEPASVITAALYGEYFPNPTVEFHRSAEQANIQTLGVTAAMLAEIIATGVLAFLVMALTDAQNRGAPGANLAPFFIGMTVAVLIAVFGPMTQACLNPARDFGPRFVAAVAGWGGLAFGTQGILPTLLVYLFSPLAGGVLGGFVYCRVIKPAVVRE